MERIGEIGLRRALGAARHHIAIQFLAESTALGAVGGMVGASVGSSRCAVPPDPSEFLAPRNLRRSSKCGRRARPAHHPSWSACDSSCPEWRLGSPARDRRRGRSCDGGAEQPPDQDITRPVGPQVDQAGTDPSHKTAECERGDTLGPAGRPFERYRGCARNGCGPCGVGGRHRSRSGSPLIAFAACSGAAAMAGAARSAVWLSAETGSRTSW